MNRAACAALALLWSAACTPTAYDADGKPITLGRFRLRTYPKGAKVWVNGKLEAVTTPATLVMNAGEYHLKIQAPGAEPIETTIVIEAGRSKDLNLRIPPPPPATISVTSDVVGADVRINGYRRGETPLSAVITRPGPVDITVVGPNHHAKSVKTHLDIGEHEHVEVFFLRDDPQPTATSTAAKKPSAPATGKLTLGLKPDGYVETEEGERLGTTPIVERVMSAGTHQLYLRSNDGRFERRVVIEVKGGQDAVFRFQLGDEDQVPGWRAPD